ncbi:MAG: hypothetical protein DI629_01135 [Mesorhizobium amorphae]|nr:MAG: hypothetical protein DI629_01135 [Mesorhizobium amorphae]
MSEDEIATLAALARSAGLSLLELQRGDTRLTLRFGEEEAQPTPLASSPAVPGDAHALAPAVGIFLPHHPLDSAGLAEGSEVEKGAVLGYVRSGTLLQAVRSPRSGRFGALLATEGEGVEYGQPVVRLD